MKKIVLLLSVIIAAAACRPEAPANVSGPSAEDITAIRKMDADFAAAFRAGNWPAITAFFADKAVLMPPNARLVMGAPAINEWYASASMTVHEFTTTSEAIGGSGNLAANRGSYRIAYTPTGAPAQIAEAGKYLWILQRQADKSWKVTSAIWNADAPPAVK